MSETCKIILMFIPEWNNKKQTHSNLQENNILVGYSKVTVEFLLSPRDISKNVTLLLIFLLSFSHSNII